MLASIRLLTVNNLAFALVVIFELSNVSNQRHIVYTSASYLFNYYKLYEPVEFVDIHQIRDSNSRLCIPLASLPVIMQTLSNLWVASDGVMVGIGLFTSLRSCSNVLIELIEADVNMS